MSIGVAQILAMALTLTLLWALYYGRKAPEPDATATTLQTDDPAPLTVTAEAPQSSCGRAAMNAAAAAKTSEPQFEMERLS